MLAVIVLVNVFFLRDSTGVWSCESRNILFENLYAHVTNVFSV